MTSMYKYIIALFFVFNATQFASAQNSKLSKGDLVDGVAAVIGDQIILESDIDEQMEYAKSMGSTSTNRCEFLENLMNNKVMIHQAKQDTLITVNPAKIKAEAEKKYNSILSRSPSEAEMLKMYKFRTPYEMKTALEKLDTEQQYFQEKLQKVTTGIDVTPSEVTAFYEKNKASLPDVEEQIILAQIKIKPELTLAHKQELIDKLNKIKAEILAGADFATQAQIYSDDKASLATGGLYKNTPRGAMVKEFEGAALSMDEGQISDPVESEFGFHLIQLIKKKGNFYDARHILLEAKPNEEEIRIAKEKLDSIRTEIKEGKISFKDAVSKYSTDKATKYNGGLILDNQGNDKLPRLELPTQIGFHISGVKEGEMTDVFEDTSGRTPTLDLIMVKKMIPAHKMNMQDDYNSLKSIIEDRKRAAKAEAYIKESIPNIFISIADQYKKCDFKNNWHTGK